MTKTNQHENERFEALFQYASMGILVANSEGSIILANNYLLLQFGYDNSDELVGKKIETLIPSRYHPHHVGKRDEYMATRERRPMGIGRDLYGLRKDGKEFPVEISLSNYNSTEGVCSIAFVIDISKRKEIEQALMKQKEQLADINSKIEELNNDLEEKVELRTQQLQNAMLELEASRDELTNALGKEKELSDLKSRFVSMASHEFRTPLSTILSSASLVAKYTESEEQDKRDKHIKRIKSAVNNLTDLLNEFLSIGRIEDGKITANFTDFNIKEMLTEISSEIQGISKLGQTIQYEHSGNDMVHLDVSLLRNVIFNLLSNAIKFSPENAPILLSTKVQEKDICIRVKDAGLGISVEDQTHLFERFFRGANATNIQGTGLGLHIVSKYIELMEGRIDFESKLEEGTEFIIKFNQ
ncbi:MAG: PAS domain-containing sensor histidine kinase [Chitinophagaceae bacterium]